MRDPGPFPCTGCGLCCKIMGVVKKLGPSSGVSKKHAKLAAELDRGDGTCRNYDDATHKCLIYETRPFLCRVKEQAMASGTPRAVYLSFLRGCQVLQRVVPDLDPSLRITDEVLEQYLSPKEQDSCQAPRLEHTLHTMQEVKCR